MSAPLRPAAFTATSSSRVPGHGIGVLPPVQVAVAHCDCVHGVALTVVNGRGTLERRPRDAARTRRTARTSCSTRPRPSALFAVTDDLDAATVSACPTCRSRVLACLAFVDLLDDAAPHPRHRELIELADDAPTLHLYVHDVSSPSAGTAAGSTRAGPSGPTWYAGSCRSRGPSVVRRQPTSAGDLACA